MYNPSPKEITYLKSVLTRDAWCGLDCQVLVGMAAFEGIGSAGLEALSRADEGEGRAQPMKPA